MEFFLKNILWLFIFPFPHSLDFEECAHKLIKMDFPDSQTVCFEYFVISYQLLQTTLLK